MQKLKNYFIGLLLINLFIFSACDDDDTPTPPPAESNIVETAIATDDLSILVDALTQAGLVSTLEGDGPFTVFAPTNAAFQTLLDSNPDWNTLADIDNETLTNVLTFHVLNGEVKAADLTDDYVNSLAVGPNEENISLQIDVTGGVKFNGSATPTTTDISNSNGIVHIIDEVMLPPNVVEFALNNPIFSNLVAALTRADLTTDFVSILTGDGPFTVFAPTNDAFEALLNSNSEWNTLNDIPVETLEAVLTYHVVSGANVQSGQLTDNQTITTLGGTFVTDFSDGLKLTTTAGQSVDITVVDVQGTNGVIHVVNQVLLAEGEAPKNIVETAIATDDLSILVDALTQTGLASALEAEGPFTVFAPTNAAFQDLLDSNPAWNSLADIDNTTLTNVLLFHVLGKNVLAGDLTDKYENTLSLGPNDEPLSLQIDVTGGVAFNGSSLPVMTDIETTNGTVHTIDKVMLPPSVVDLALNNPVFSTLVAALTRDDLNTDFVSVLTAEGPFTVFAPTNDAFQALLDSNPDWTVLDDIPVATLEAVLTYHVVSGANVKAGQLTDNQEIDALGGTLTVDLSNGAKLETTSSQSVGIILTDVQGANGVVHVVEEVLLP